MFQTSDRLSPTTRISRFLTSYSVKFDINMHTGVPHCLLVELTSVVWWKIWCSMFRLVSGNLEVTYLGFALELSNDQHANIFNSSTAKLLLPNPTDWQITEAWLHENTPRLTRYNASPHSKFWLLIPRVGPPTPIWVSPSVSTTEVERAHTHVSNWPYCSYDIKNLRLILFPQRLWIEDCWWIWTP